MLKEILGLRNSGEHLHEFISYVQGRVKARYLHCVVVRSYILSLDHRLLKDTFAIDVRKL